MFVAGGRRHQERQCSHLESRKFAYLQQTVSVKKYDRKAGSNKSLTEVQGALHTLCYKSCLTCTDCTYTHIHIAMKVIIHLKKLLNSDWLKGVWQKLRPRKHISQSTISRSEFSRSEVWAFVTPWLKGFEAFMYYKCRFKVKQHLMQSCTMRQCK